MPNQWSAPVRCVTSPRSPRSPQVSSPPSRTPEPCPYAIERIRCHVATVGGMASNVDVLCLSPVLQGAVSRAAKALNGCQDRYAFRVEPTLPARDEPLDERSARRQAGELAGRRPLRV